MLNICADNNIPTRAAKRVSEQEMRFIALRSNGKAVWKLADRAGMECEVVRERGSSVIVKRFRRRYALWVAPMFIIAAVFIASQFIWDIEVVGNERISTNKILSVLDECGFRQGIFGPEIDTRMLSDMVLSRIDDLSFMAVNIRGSKAEVIVHERVLPPPKGNLLLERSEAVYLQLSASMPLKYASKRFTGAEITQNALMIGKLRINFYFSTGNYRHSCDIIEERRRLTLFGYAFPFEWRTRRMRPWIEEVGTLDSEKAAAMLKARLSDRFDGEVIEEAYKTVVSGGTVTVIRSIKTYE
ncbi:MAG: sporulation protein YqfD [Oscillospiraceae bacterium]|jgi:hypothetical protein|nr:sporulation protein YqfD [Oscillospiraceae bacterium]